MRKVLPYVDSILRPFEARNNYGPWSSGNASRAAQAGRRWSKTARASVWPLPGQYVMGLYRTQAERTAARLERRAQRRQAA